MKFACRGRGGRRAGASGGKTGGRFLARSGRTAAGSRNRSTSHRSVRAHECVRNAVAVIGIAVLAVLAAVLPPARGRRRLHRAAREGGRRRQSAVVSVVARHAKAGAVGGGGCGART